MLTTTVSDKAQAFLKEKHIAILSTFSKDGSVLLTPMWYLFDDDDRIILNSEVHTQKVKNIRRNPHASICIVEGTHYVSIAGSIKLIDDQTRVLLDFEQLVDHYIEDEATREQYKATFAKRPRIALHFTGEKSTELFL